MTPFSTFHAELRVTDDGISCVEVALGQRDQRIVDVLNAIEDYVTQRATGPARIAFNGHKCPLHAVPPSPAAD
jgi:hypothetical protein